VEEVGIGDTKTGVTVEGGGVEGEAGTRLRVLISPEGAAREAQPAGFYMRTQRMVPRLKGDLREGEVVEDEEVDKMIARRITMVVVAMAVERAGVKRRRGHAEDGSPVMRKKRTTTRNRRNPSSS
jgi:hypothetical protein